MIAESVAFLVARGQAGDLRRRALLRRLPRRPRVRAASACARPPDAGAERLVAVRHQRRLAAARGRRGAARSCAALCRRARSASTRHNDAECAVANTLAAVDEGAAQVQGTMNGIRRAHAATRTSISIIPNLQLKMGYDVLAPSGWRG